MSTPFHPTITPSFAERVARALHNNDPERIDWAELFPAGQVVAIEMARADLVALAGDGLAVVELPGMEPWPDGPAGWAARFGPVEAHVDDDGTVAIRVGGSRAVSITWAETVGAALLAAAQWATTKGGEPR